MDSKLNEFMTTAPSLITQGAYHMDTFDEKLMAIYAATTVSSGMIPKVWFNYDNKVNFPQLYTVSLKPPGSGKGKMALFLRYVQRINNELIERNNLEVKKYKMQMKVYENRLKKNGPAEAGEPPVMPKLKLLLLSGNTTSSMVIQQFNENDGEMALLIFDTEIDGVTNMMGNLKFGGDNSMVYRKAYHNEPITQMRKGNTESLIANSPKLSIFLTGTPSQIKQLFKSNSDGLFSRWIVFTSMSEDLWKDVKPCDGCYPLNVVFDKIGDSYYELFWQMQGKTIEVIFSNTQWDIFNEIGIEWHRVAKDLGGENATSLAKRHVNMIARVAANYTALRAFEEKVADERIECNDQDLLNARWLIELSFNKALNLFKELPGDKDTSSGDMDVYEKMPQEFKREELVPLQISLKMSEKSMDRTLGRLIEKNMVRKIKKGFYEKITVTLLTADGSLDL
jgi:hypothetical protein